MKLFFIMLFLISCEQAENAQVETSRGLAEPERESKIVVPEITAMPIVMGTYQSECITDDSGNEYRYFMVINEYDIEIAIIYPAFAQCSGKSHTVRIFLDIVGENYDYKNTSYDYLQMGGGVEACGLSMTSGTRYDIDGYGCNLSYENKINKSFLTINESGTYMINSYAIPSL